MTINLTLPGQIHACQMSVRRAQPQPLYNTSLSPVPLAKGKGGKKCSCSNSHKPDFLFFTCIPDGR